MTWAKPTPNFLLQKAACSSQENDFFNYVYFKQKHYWKSVLSKTKYFGWHTQEKEGFWERQGKSHIWSWCFSHFPAEVAPSEPFLEQSRHWALNDPIPPPISKLSLMLFFLKDTSPCACGCHNCKLFESETACELGLGFSVHRVQSLSMTLHPKTLTTLPLTSHFKIQRSLYFPSEYEEVYLRHPVYSIRCTWAFQPFLCPFEFPSSTHCQVNAIWLMVLLLKHISLSLF